MVVRVVARDQPVVVQGLVEPVVEPLCYAGVQQQHNEQAAAIECRQRPPPGQDQAQQRQANAVEDDHVVPGKQRQWL